MVLMQLILKCGDISNVSWPFELSNQWCDVLCDEFFRQGYLEKTQGIEQTNPLHNLVHLEKPQSQIRFYQFVCLVLYETAASVCRPLRANGEQMK
jgi:hypothetical protein